MNPSFLPAAKIMRLFGLPCLIMLFAASCASEPSAEEAQSVLSDKPSRIVSLNGSITELLFTLGEGHRIVGIDVTSTYPEAAVDSLAQLGHTTQLNIEALLALKPDLVLADSSAMATNASLDVIRGAGVEVMLLSMGEHLSASHSLARQLQGKLQLQESSVAGVLQKVRNDSLALSKYLTDPATAAPPRTLFLYARGPNRIMVGGTGTSADAMLRHAGAVNAAGVEGFANLTPESVVASQPEALLLFDSGLASLDGAEGLARVPGLAASPAMQQKRVVAMDGHYLLSFGPRAAEAALVLAKALRGQSAEESAMGERISMQTDKAPTL